MWRRRSFAALTALGAACLSLVGLSLVGCGNGQIEQPSSSYRTGDRVETPWGPGTINTTGNVVLDNGLEIDPESGEVVEAPVAAPEVSDAPAAVVPQTDPVTPDRGADFPYEESLAAFQATTYPTLVQYCSTCHSTTGAGLRPLHSDVDVRQAHDAALGLVNLRQVKSSRLVTRLLIDGHNCWGTCTENAELMRASIQAWADQLSLPPTVNPEPPDGVVSEQYVEDAIAADLANFSADDQQFIRYASLHTLYNYHVTQDDLNVARAGLSKVLNSVARYAPEIVNPVPVDEYLMVYRFDIRDYWGYSRAFDLRGSGVGEVRMDEQAALDAWARIEQGITTFSPDDTEMDSVEIPAPTEQNPEATRVVAANPNISGFYPDPDGDGVNGRYVEAAQLAYTLSRPDLYNELLRIPGIASLLERELGVDSSVEYQFMTVNDAITIGERLMWRTNIPNGYYWRSVDQFSTIDFVFYDRPIPAFTNTDRSQVITTPVQQGGDGNGTPNEYTGDTGAQAQAAEVIFSLPNGLQAYGIFGAGNQRRVDAFTFIVVDPRRGGAIDSESSFGSFRRGDGSDWRLLNGASCMSCHVEGMNRAPDDMRPYIAANPNGTWTQLANADGVVATEADVERLFPGTETMSGVIENDRNFFMSAMQRIQNEMIVGTSDKNLYVEPIMYLFEAAQQLYGYKNTISN